jgi:hypothetical protein
MGPQTLHAGLPDNGQQLSVGFPAPMLKPASKAPPCQTAPCRHKVSPSAHVPAKAVRTHCQHRAHYVCPEGLPRYAGLRTRNSGSHPAYC